MDVSLYLFMEKKNFRKNGDKLEKLEIQSAETEEKLIFAV